MRRHYRALAAGLAMVAGSVVLDVAGTSLESLFLLVVSFALAIAGALLAVRGIIEFVAESSQ